MNKLTPALLALLAVSISGNVLAVARLSRPESAPKQRALVESRAPEGEEPRSVAAAPGSRVEAAAPQAAAGGGGPAVVPASRASAMLSDIEDWTGFLLKLQKLSQVVDELGGEHYQELAWEMTSEYLGVDAVTVKAATKTMWEEVDRADEEHSKAMALLPPRKGESGWGPAEQTRADELGDRHAAALVQAMETFKRILSPESSRRHQRFAARVGVWSQVLRSPDSGVRAGW